MRTGEMVSNSNRLFVEWCPKVVDRKGMMVDLQSLSRLLKYTKDAGYRSVYAFKEKDAARIKKAKSSQGFSKYSVTSSQLFIDLDNGYKDVATLEERFSNYTYEVWDSGSKGFHFVIRIVPMEGKCVPAAQKKFVEELNINADLSLYRHGSLISLPGRIHPVTRRKKSLVKKNTGKSLEISQADVIDDYLPKFQFTQYVDDTQELYTALIRLAGVIDHEPKEGNRHSAMWSIAKNFADAGIEEATTLELLRAVNNNWENPKCITEVMRAVNQAY